MARPRLPRGSVLYHAMPYKRSVVLVTSRADFMRVQKACGDEVEDPGECNGAACVIAGSDVLIGVFNSSMCTLVHELCHACLMLFGIIGANPSECGGEPYAYLYEDMYRYFSERMTCG